jgi:hypothetical protein
MKASYLGFSLVFVFALSGCSFNNLESSSVKASDELATAEPQ